jgi:hypothetical protein
MKRAVVEEGVHGREAGVAGAYAVAPGCLEMLEEGADDGGVEVFEVEFGRRLSLLLLDEAQQ